MPVKRVLKKINPDTGKPRNWICSNHGFVDSIINDAETIYHYGWASMRLKEQGKIQSATFYAAMPDDVLGRLAKSWQQTVEGMLRELTKRNKKEIKLTAAELSYCEAEDIKPQDFLERKAMASR